MAKVVIIDDEPNSRELLEYLLNNYFEDISIIGTAEDVKSGIQLLQSTQPEVILLDIEMPGGNGFDILDACADKPFKVIFITGYDHYAIKAIKYAAVDYLLKPINIEELKLALAKIDQTTHKGQIDFVQNHYQREVPQLSQIILPNATGFNVVDLSDIIRIESKDGYTICFLKDHRYTTSHTMSHYEDLLPSHLFFRVHKSHIVNCQKVEKFEAGRVGQVSLEDGSTVPLAARRKSAFMTLLSNFNSNR